MPYGGWPWSAEGGSWTIAGANLKATAAGLIAAALISLPAGAFAAPPPDLDAYVHGALQQFGAPGLSLAIVENGQVAVAKGYGVRSLDTGQPVDAHTAFPIGSESKAFTAAALAILVDQGKLSWDDRVVDRLPGFQMYDPYATAHMTVRDLLTHRSGLGLGEGDLLVIPGTRRSRADIVHALRYLKPVTGFRETFAYDNILYIVAGALVEAVSGQSWENFVTDNILKPGGLSDAYPDYRADAPNGVALHARTGGPIRGVGEERTLPEAPGFEAMGPAGGINASASDMARWMQIQLAQGRLPDGRLLFSPKQSQEMFSPVVVVPPVEFKLPPGLEAMQPDLQSYALGWFVESYRGHIVLEHSGAVFGALAMLYLIPDKHIGISVTINSEDSSARRAVMFHLLDHYLDLPPTDWMTALKTARENSVAQAEAALKAAGPAPEFKGAPSSPLASYAGHYSDPWYGGMTVSQAGDKALRISFDQTPGMEGPLEPLGGDRFRAHWTNKNIEDAYVEFSVTNGRAVSARLKAASPLADFSFDYQDLNFTR